MGSIQDIASEGIELCDSLLNELEEYDFDYVHDNNMGYFQNADGLSNAVGAIKGIFENAENNNARTVEHGLHIHHQLGLFFNMKGVAFSEMHPIGQLITSINP